MEIYNFFNQGWVGSFIGIVGIIVAVLTYYKSKIGARLACNINSSRVIGKSEAMPDEISIHYKGSEVSRVTRTTAILWNSGTKTIFGSNIVEKDPLRIEVNKKEKIIGFNILKNTNDSNEFEITVLNSNSIKIDFNFLDSKDGVTFEMLHTDETLDPYIKGTIIGMPKGTVLERSSSYPNKTSLRLLSMFTNPKFILGISMVVGIFFIGVYMLSKVLAFKQSPNTVLELPNEGTSKALLILGIFYFAVPTLLLILSRRKYPKSLKIN